MFHKLNHTQADEILLIKINEIEISSDYSEKDKHQMVKYYRKKLRGRVKRH